MTAESGQRISSRNTFFLKRVFPFIWFGCIAVTVVVALTALRHSTKPVPLVIFIVPVFVLILVYVLLRRLVFDLADEVWDEGDALRVRFGTEEDRIPLQDIMNISYAGLTNPPRVTLTLRQARRFGRNVTFSPIQKLFGPLLRTSNPIVTDLIERVDAARRR
jgi:hypothetical protein